MADTTNSPTLIDRFLNRNGRTNAPPGDPNQTHEMTTGNGQVAAELIGRSVVANAQASIFKSRARVKTIDDTVPDYEFYDRLRRGKARGYTLAGLFCEPIEQKFASWVLGKGVTVGLKDGPAGANPNDPRQYTDERLAEFVGRLFDEPEDGGDSDGDSSPIVQIYKDTLGLGDQYVIVNVDGSLSIPSPDTVEVERDPRDYRQVTAVTVTTRADRLTITDRYEPGRRLVTVNEGAKVVEEQEYPNLIGRIPVVHFANERSANETNGRPIHETLLPLFDQYDDMIYKQLDGAKLLGAPLLAFVGMEDINAVINANDPAEQDTYTDRDGSTATRTQLNVDQNALLLVGKGGDAKFVSPPVGFTEDTKTALKSLFLLLLDHTGIPEFIWGGEMGSSRSSTESQMVQWVRDVTLRQKRLAGPLLKLCAIWLAIEKLTDGRIVLDKLTATWPPLVEEDQAQALERIKYADSTGKLTAQTTLELLDLVDDPAGEIEAAGAEGLARQERFFPDGSTAAFRQQLNGDDEEETGDGDEEQDGS